MRWAPIVLVVVSTVLYQLGQRAIPAGANALVATVAAYVVATAGAVLLMPLLARDVALASSWRTLNYGTLLVGVGALGIEIGFLLAYRAGWAISNVSMVANAMVALALLLIGALRSVNQSPLRAAPGLRSASRDSGSSRDRRRPDFVALRVLSRRHALPLPEPLAHALRSLRSRSVDRRTGCAVARAGELRDSGVSVEDG